MPHRVACQMDPIDRIDIAGDSTFALLLEAQRRGHSLFYYTPPNLALLQGRLIARGTTLRVEDKAGDHYSVSDPRTVDLSELDVVLLRQDPPFDMAYITTTHLLERIHPRTLVVNDPAHVRNAPEKVFVLDFLDLMPPTLVTRSLDDVKRFRVEEVGVRVEPPHHAVDRFLDQLVIGNRLDVVALDLAEHRRKELQVLVGDRQPRFALREHREVQAQQQPEHRTHADPTCLLHAFAHRDLCFRF